MADRKRDAAPTPWLEWAVGAAGALAFSAVIAVLVASALRADIDAPVITVTVERVVATDEGYVVKLLARNRGGLTAADVKVTAALEPGEGAREAREVTFDFVPAHSERRGGVVFQHDPRSGSLTFETESYVDP